MSAHNDQSARSESRSQRAERLSEYDKKLYQLMSDMEKHNGDTGDMLEWLTRAAWQEARRMRKVAESVL